MFPNIFISRLYTVQQDANLSVFRGFRQRAVNCGSVFVRQFAASEGTLISASIAI